MQLLRHVCKRVWKSVWQNRAAFAAIALAGVAPTAMAAPLTVFNGKLSPGFDMGIDSEKGTRNWATAGKDGICLDYPGGQRWGAMFVTVGKPKNPPRPQRDFSAYRTLSLELKGKTGKESVAIGIKDNTDPDNGKEARAIANNVPKSWKKYQFPLSVFKTADLKNLYVPLQLVFGQQPTSLCVRNIQYLD